MVEYSEIVEKGFEKLRNIGREGDIAKFQGEVAGCESGWISVSNREFFKNYSLKMRMLDSREADTTVDLFDCTLDTPITSGAMSGMGNIEKNPLIRIAEGLKKAGSMFWMGIGGDEQLRSAIETGCPTVKISKPYEGNEKIIEKIGVAEDAGAVGVGMDIDFFYGGKSDDNTFRKGLMAPKTKEELEDIISTVDVPFVVKGVLSVEDAVKAEDAGADALVVSNHGASVLDHAAHPLQMLSEIEDEVGGELDILAGSGFRRGTDVLKGLALGAEGILLGRITMVGLAAEGSEGVENIFRAVTGELKRCMSLTGCRSVSEVDEDILVKNPNHC